MSFIIHYIFEILVIDITISIIVLFLFHINRYIGSIGGLILLGLGYLLTLYAGGDVYDFFFWVAIPVIVLSTILLMVFSKKKDKPQDGPFCVELLDDKKKKHYIPDINRGVSIFGSSGSGKSAGPIHSLLKHLSKHKFAGIINDYKDFELTKIAYPIFKEHGIPFHVFAPHDVNRSVRINVIAPKLIKSETELNGIISTLVLNLSQSEADNDTAKFFRDGEESLLSGVIWRLRDEYPEKCNLPFVIALLLTAQNHHEKIEQRDGTVLIKPYQKLVDFICQDQRAEIQASVFLTGIQNDRQTASLYSTLAANLRKLATPELFYLLGDNDIGLDLNSMDNRCVLSFVNKPGNKESIISPVNAMIIEACFSAMSEHGRDPSFAVIDEAPTIKMMGLGSKIATLRSYGVSFTYCLQDKVQGVSQFGGKDYKIKEILSNLSTQFMGKANDADTAKYYEKFFEIIKEEQKSVSTRHSDWFLPSSNNTGVQVTTSHRDKSKIQAHEFFALKQGEFIMFTDGQDDKFRFFYKKPYEETPPIIRDITGTELDMNFERILHDASTFFESKIDNTNIYL